MRVEHGLRAAALGVALAVAAGCGVLARLTRPEGDGGWSPAHREEELGRRAAAAGVTYPATALAPGDKAPAGPLTLADALALAAGGNRRIAEAEKQVEGARQRVWSARGRLCRRPPAPAATPGTPTRSPTR
jgi:hypothetical protein